MSLVVRKPVFGVSDQVEVSRSLRPQSASCSILALRSPYACFYLILAILNYFNLSSVFILNYHAFYSLLYFNFFCLILTDAAPTCLECPRGRVAVYRERKERKVRHKPGCTATEDGQNLEISDLGRRGIALSV